jgi:hypothetical protein
LSKKRDQRSARGQDHGDHNLHRGKGPSHGHRRPTH